MADPTEQLAVDRRELGDTELLKRYLEGDSESFAVLMERYRKELYNFLVRFTGDHAGRGRFPGDLPPAPHLGGDFRPHPQAEALAVHDCRQ